VPSVADQRAAIERQVRVLRERLDRMGRPYDKHGRAAWARLRNKIKSLERRADNPWLPW